MKLLAINEKIILYLNKMYISSLDFSDKELADKYLKKLFVKISNKYDIEFNGYYLVKLYVDTNYGVIIEIKNEELEYLDYFSNQIEMNTEVVYGSFLYEISDLNEEFVDDFTIYKFDNKFYLRVRNDVSDMEMGKLLEHAKIIYGISVSNIIKKGKVVRWYYA